MIKSYEQFKSKIFNNKDQLRDMLNILYNVDKLRPMVIDAYNIIEQVEREKKNQKVKKALLEKNVVQFNKRKASQPPLFIFDKQGTSMATLVCFLIHLQSKGCENHEKIFGVINKIYFDNQYLKMSPY